MRIRNTILSAALLAALAGCNSGTTTEPPTTGEPGKTTEAPADGKQRLSVGVVFDTGGRGDQSFNDSAYAGLDRATKDMGINPQTADSKQVADYERNLRILAEQKVPLIIAVGISMKTPVEKVAPEFPETKFALIDEVVDSPNVRGIKFREEEGSFLVGYLAGLMTKSGQVGFVGGQEIPLIKKFEAGYIAGVMTANKTAKVLPAKYTGSWTDVDMGKQCAKTLFGQGADIVYHASGGCGKGVIQAAKETGKYAIGVDSDQDHLAEGRVLTSMIKRVDEAVYQTIKDFRDGKFEGGEKIYDLKAGGVGISDLKFTKDAIGAENLKKVDEIKAKIVAGEIKVPSSPEELDAFLKTLK